MASFLKEFLLEDPTRLNPGSGSAVFLAAFGKHPAWKDHVEAIGLSTPSLVVAAQQLYEQGIGGKGGPITSGAWDKLPPEEALPGFGHVFVWWRSDQFLLGRMWASSDSAYPPRARYPLIVCLHVLDVPLMWAVRNLLPRLEEVPVFCRLQSAEEIDTTVKQVCNSEAYRDELRSLVQSGFDRLEQGLRTLAAGYSPVGASALLTSDERQQFVAFPELGPDREGLLRILHQVQSRFAAYLGPKRLTKADKATLQPAQIRVPVAAPSAAEGILRWIEFFKLVLAPDTPILFTAPQGGGWIDVTVGEPTGDQFFCLRASPAAVPLTSSIPFTLDASLREKGAETINAFLTNKPPSDPEPATHLKDSATAFIRRMSAKAEVPEKPQPARKRLWMIAGLALAVVLVGVFAWPKRGQPKLKAGNAASVSVLPKPATNPPVQARPPEDGFSKILAEARAAEQAKDLARALAGYEAALKLRPDDSECARRIEALKKDLAALELEKKFQDILAAARMAEEKKDYDKALVEYQEAGKLKPDHAECSQKITMIRQALATAAEQKRFSETFAAAQAAEQAKEYEKALAGYQEAIKLKPDDLECAQKLKSMKNQLEAVALQERFTATLAAAHASELAKDFRTALARYEEALKLKPGEPECVHKTQALRQTLADADALDTALAAARKAEQAKDSNAALAAYRKVLKLSPRHPEASEAAARIEKTMVTSAATNPTAPVAQPVTPTAVATGQTTKPEAQNANPSVPSSPKPAELHPPLKSSVGMELVWVPGLPETKEGGYVGRYEVTQEEYQKVMGKNPSKFTPAAQKKAGLDSSLRLPVESVEHEDAVKFCEELTDKDGAGGSLRSGWIFALPSTTQWKFFLADATSENAVTSYKLSEPRKSPLQVGKLPANKFGLHDVQGNVWEWSSNWELSSDGVSKKWVCNGFDFSYPNPKGKPPVIGFRCIAVPKP